MTVLMYRWLRKFVSRFSWWEVCCSNGKHMQCSSDALQWAFWGNRSCRWEPASDRNITSCWTQGMWWKMRHFYVAKTFLSLDSLVVGHSTSDSTIEGSKPSLPCYWAATLGKLFISTRNTIASAYLAVCDWPLFGALLRQPLQFAVLGTSCCIFPAVPRSTKTFIFHGMVNWVSAFELSNNYRVMLC